MQRITAKATLHATLLVLGAQFTGMSAFAGTQPPALQNATPNPQPPASPACTGSDATTIWTSSNQATAALCGKQNGKLSVYYGIPYTQTPPARWADAQTASWPPSPSLQAITPQNICVQSSNAATPPPMGEDCLYLNVWAPTATLNTPSAKLPVMVFIHGGAFVSGSGSSPLYDGSALAQNNVIVVTLNYRLGAFGFFAADVASGNASATQKDANPPVSLNGNFGLNDQRAALQWVQNNIAYFGGDPSQVTLFGESAGAMSTGIHLFASPASQGLFQAAIMESNPLGSLYRSLGQTKAEGAAFINQLCSDWYTGPGSCPQTASWLGGLSPAQILESQTKFVYLGTGSTSQQSALASDISGMSSQGGNIADSLAWSPTIDQSTILAQPAAGYATNMPPKPFAFGTNANEGALFAAMIANTNHNKTDGLAPLLPAEYNIILSKVFNDQKITNKITSFSISATENQISVAGKINQQQITVKPYNAPANNPPNYYGTSQITNGTAQTINNLINDFAFQCANLWTASQAYSQTNSHTNTPIYAYNFTQLPILNLYQTSNGSTVAACDPSAGNVCHGDELPYVFGTLQAALTLANSSTQTVPTGDAAVSSAMTAAWASFAKNPTSPTGFTAYAPTGNLTQFAYATSGSNPTTSAQVAVSTLSDAHNCAALWNKLGVYP